MPRPDALEKTKARLLRDLEHKPWLVSLGTGKIDGAVGLIVSVKKGRKGPATRMLRSRKIDVPFRVREVGLIRTRAEPERRRSSGVDVTALREEALKRSRRG